MSPILLGVNIDHIATLRQVRGTHYPDPIAAGVLAEQAGADSITVHLREDRRHIQDRDVVLLKATLNIPLNLEMAVTDDMLRMAEDIEPQYSCFVPEKREELTTEGGLDVVAHFDNVKQACKRLRKKNIRVSLFINPDATQIDAAVGCGAPAIELHTGAYADATTDLSRQKEYIRIQKACDYAHQKGMIVNAGHGLHYHNVQPIAALPHVHELNIGHSIIARAVMCGLPQAVRDMKALMDKSRT